MFLTVSGEVDLYFYGTTSSLLFCHLLVVLDFQLDEVSIMELKAILKG